RTWPGRRAWTNCSRSPTTTPVATPGCPRCGSCPRLLHWPHMTDILGSHRSTQLISAPTRQVEVCLPFAALLFPRLLPRLVRPVPAPLSSRSPSTARVVCRQIDLPLAGGAQPAASLWQPAVRTSQEAAAAHLEHESIYASRAVDTAARRCLRVGLPPRST